MTHADGSMSVAEALKQLAEAVAKRLRGHDAEIAELRAEIERLKAGPRMTVAQRARERGAA
jgi:cell division protein FtsB